MLLPDDCFHCFNRKKHGVDIKKEKEEVDKIIQNINRFRPAYIENHNDQLEALFMPVTLDTDARKNIIEACRSTISDIMNAVKELN